MRFGMVCDDPCTLEEAGAAFGVTRERVRQIEIRAIRKLQNMVSEDSRLREYISVML